MIFIALLGILIIVVGLIIAAVIFFVVDRDEKKDKNKDILDS